MICENCNNEHNGTYGSGRFCSSKCARGFSTKAKREEINNRVSLKMGGNGAVKRKRICKTCGKVTQTRNIGGFCSAKCKHDDTYENYIRDWKNHINDGSKSQGMSVSNHIRRYLLQKYDGKCSRCGWDKKNPYINKCILEVEHIDGNCLNNKEENLDLICPNCHSLTPTYRALNTGNGNRQRLKYYKLI